VLRSDSGQNISGSVTFYVSSDPPAWSLFSANESYPKQGDFVLFSSYWEGDSALDSWTFSWNATQSGEWENVSSGSISGTGDYSNTTLEIPVYLNSQYGFRFYANDSYGLQNATDIGYFTVSGDMLVSLDDPLDGKLVAQDIIFLLNATVTCTNGTCGSVQSRARYNQSTTNPDTDISTSHDTPFYITSGSNPGSCAGTLDDGDSCQVEWDVNATGIVGSSWEVGALFESSQDNVLSNHTGNSTIQIVSCIIDLTLQFDNVSFEAIEPSMTSNATGNQYSLYNITIEPTTTCNIDVYGRADDFEREEGGYSIPVQNMTFSNTTNQVSEGVPMSSSWKVLGLSRQPDTNLTTYYWLHAPLSIMEGPYNSTLYVQGLEEGEQP
jgi:hypothetical protein